MPKIVTMLKLEIMPGATINDAVKGAKDIANQLACYTNFEFNGHSVVVPPGADDIDHIVAAFEQRLNKQ